MMKHAKKLASLLLALVMAMAMMAVPAFAAEETGSITINNALSGETYKVYRIFDLEGVSANHDAYAYTVNSDWTGFIETDGAKKYISVDLQGYVTWNKENPTETDKAAFASLALQYAQNNSINATKTATAPSGGENVTVSFSGLEFGYYVVDSDSGVLLLLTLDENTKTTESKNTIPSLDKDIPNPSNLKIGDTVVFQITIYARAGATNYVVHDKMSDGLDFGAVTGITVASLKDGSTEEYADATTLIANGQDAQYTVATEDLKDTCDFEITFEEDFLKTLKTDDKIVVTYTATINKDAVIKTDDDTNTNDARLEFGNNHVTDWDEEKVDLYKFDLVKTNSSNILLSGAKFELYDAATGGNKISLVKENDESYRVATSDEKNIAGFTSAVIEAGKATIKGLGSGTYYLEETEAPAGYNKISDRISVTISGANNLATITNGKYESGGVRVENNTGSQLPGTGGMGTTVFYVLGGVLMAGAVVLLITKKRMGQTEK